MTGEPRPEDFSIKPDPAPAAANAEGFETETDPIIERLEQARAASQEGPAGEVEKNENMTERQRIAKRLFALLSGDNRVNFALTMGSTAENKENELSDVDVCVVMKDDVGLNGILREVNVLFRQLGELVDYYAYSPYHFYVVFKDSIPLDIYFISSSLYFTVRSDKNKMAVDNRKKTPEGGDESTKEGLRPLVRDMFLRSYIRTYRLLSKVNKGDYVTLIYILNSIREEQLVPLISMVKGYKIPHIKAVKLGEFDPDLRDLFERTYPAPTREKCLDAVRATSQLIQTLFKAAAENMDLGDLQRDVDATHEKIMQYQ